MAIKRYKRGHIRCVSTLICPFGRDFLFFSRSSGRKLFPAPRKTVRRMTPPPPPRGFVAGAEFPALCTWMRSYVRRLFSHIPSFSFFFFFSFPSVSWPLVCLDVGEALISWLYAYNCLEMPDTLDRNRSVDFLLSTQQLCHHVPFFFLFLVWGSCLAVKSDAKAARPLFLAKFVYTFLTGHAMKSTLMTINFK